MERGNVARWQRKMKDSQSVWCLQNEEMKKLGVGGGLKKNGRRLLGFACASWVSHNVRNDFGVRNDFADPLGFRTMCEMVLGLRKFSHGLRKFRTVIEMILQGGLIFARCAKLVRRVCEISHTMWNDWWILHALRKIRRVCELSCFLLCLKSPAIDHHKKSKLNQTKIKLKWKIKIKTTNNMGKLLKNK